MAWSMLVWLTVGWVVSSSLFYVLKNLNPDKGVCLKESFDRLKDQLTEGQRRNFSNLHGECFFSNDYITARNAFHKAAQFAGVEVMEIPLHENEKSLTHSVAIFRGNPEKVLLHLSGVHGVEGYAGSAVQNAALQFIGASGLYQDPAKAQQLPTLIFYHAVNPYGFNHNRRTNEDNIDLNRNFLTDEEFEFVKNRDPNYSGFVDLDTLLNPTSMPFSNPYLNDIYWLFTAAKYMLSHGFVSIKRAMVAGNYHKQQGYGFGGFQRAASVNNLVNFLTTEKVPELAKLFHVIDVHTGLGPTGVDTMIIEEAEDGEWIEAAFPIEHDRNGKVIGGIKTFSFGSSSPLKKLEKAQKSPKSKASNSDAEKVGSGYDLTVGTSKALCETFITPHLPLKNKLCLTQEFGTVPTFFVGKGSMEENFALFHGSPEQKSFYSARYRPLFYVETRDWKRRIVARGLLVLLQAIDHLQKTSP